MTTDQRKRVSDLAASIFEARSKMTVSEWCCAHLRFDEPNNRGPFSLHAREYIREPLDTWADPTITDMVPIFGSQAGKTGIVMGGIGWSIENLPSRVVWVMPTRDSGSAFARERWIPMLLASECFQGLIPEGAARHKFVTRAQHVGAAIISMTWSNSPSALSSTPAPIVVLDEVDKFNKGTRGETDAVNLAEQRTKKFSMPKRFKSSTPTLFSGLAWQEFLKTDQRRRYLPCPLCGKYFVLAWSKNFTLLKLTGDEAFIVWDKEAKRADGTWDLDRVERSTRAVCPHCAGHIQDGSKTAMDRAGEWRATATAAKGYRGWHLPSLYASGVQTAWPKMAVKFLQAQKSLQGVKGFINGDLAEPYQAQDTLGERVEIITSKLEATAEWTKLLTVDCQQKTPHFWHVVRAWNGKKSEGISGGPLDTWDEIETVQRMHNIPNVCVAVDAGWGAYDEAEVYKNCARRSEIEPRAKEGRLPFLAGWMPTKGMPGRKTWKDQESGLYVHYYLRPTDPFSGSSDAGQVEISLLEFSADYYKDVLEQMRLSRDGWEWKVSAELSTPIYWQHLDAEVKAAQQNKNGFVKWAWVKRSKHWPDHLRDCEVLQIAHANFLQICRYE